MRTPSGSAAPVYAVLIEEINAYCERENRQPVPKTDREIATLLGTDPSMLSKLKSGRIALSRKLIDKILTVLCTSASETDKKALEHRLNNPSSPHTSNVRSPEAAFVQRFGVKNAVLFVELADVWPSAFDIGGASQMSRALKVGMETGMSVILFVPHELRPVRARIYLPSMSNGMVDQCAERLFIQLRRLNAERVALYHLAENTCPAPPVGVRITGLLPNRSPESRLLIADGPSHYQFVSTSRNPDDLILFILGLSSNTQEMPPTQDNLEITWAAWRDSANLPDDRPCPIRRWIVK